MGLKALLILGFLALCHCSKLESQACIEVMPQPDNRPSIMVVGDSISIGYTSTLRSALPNFQVFHSTCNAQNSGYTLSQIDTWLASRPSFEAITWNNGLWDIRYQISDAEYASNLHAIAAKIKAKTAHPTFVLTTNVLPGTPLEDNPDVIDKNAIATQVMAQEGIPVMGLYAVSLTIVNDHISPTNVHYTSLGYQVLGDALLSFLNLTYGIN